LLLPYIGRSVHEILNKIGKRRRGYQLHALKTLKFDGTTQNIPVTNIYTDRQYRITSGDDSEVQPRFDWVSLIDGNGDLTQVQLLCLLEATYPNKQNKQESCTLYLYIAADTCEITKRRPHRYLYIHDNIAYTLK